MKIIVFNKVNGNIIRKVQCAPQFADMQIQDGEGYIIDEYEDTNSKFHIIDVDARQRVEKTIDQLMEDERRDQEWEERHRNPKAADEELIKNKTDEIIRRLAIEELKKEGKLKNYD